MPSLIEEVVNEITLYTPEATSDQIANYLIQLMEKEILPEALRRVSLPRRPSPLEELRIKHWLRRVRKRRRAIEEQRLEIWRVVEQFESVRHAINGFPVDISDFRPRELGFHDGTNVFRERRLFQGTLSRRGLLRGDGFPIIESMDVKKRIEELGKVLPYNPYKEKEERKPRFYFDRIVQHKILADTLFSRNVSFIESAAKLFALSKTLQADFFLSFRRDSEIPEWKKYILTINVPGIDFDTKMKLWDEFDAFIRERIRERLLHAPKEEAKKLKKLNKTLFTRVELGAGHVAGSL
jgi:hypothetical protein